MNGVDLKRRRGTHTPSGLCYDAIANTLAPRLDPGQLRRQSSARRSIPGANKQTSQNSSPNPAKSRQVPTANVQSLSSIDPAQVFNAHLEAFANQVDSLRTNGRLSGAERGALAEALLAVAGPSGPARIRDGSPVAVGICPAPVGPRARAGLPRRAPPRVLTRARERDERGRTRGFERGALGAVPRRAVSGAVPSTIGGGPR